MEGRIRMVPEPFHVLQPNNKNNEQKENRHATRVILHTNRKRESSDSELEEPWTSSDRPNKGNPPKFKYVTNADGGIPRRRGRHASPATPVPVPSHVIARRNERERNRVKQVNDSFAVLRNRIPEYLYESEASDDPTKPNTKKKLSKVETLRLAVDYIQQLEVLLNLRGDDSEAEDNRSDLKMLSDIGSDTMDLSSDSRSVNNDRDFGYNVKTEEGYSEDEVAIKVEKFDDMEREATTPVLPPLAQSFPNKGIPIAYSDLCSP